MCGECNCGKETEDCEEITTEEIVYENNFVLNALIELMVEKKIMTKEEFEKKLTEMEKEIEEE